MQRPVFPCLRAALAIALLCMLPPAGIADPALPQRLHDTGLYADDGRSVADENLPYAPQYTLWSDGATKRRWLYLPPGSRIDASDPDAWQFPPGTKLWKEFSHGRPVETRMIERLPNGSWRFAAYVWNEDGTDTHLAPAEGYRRLPVAAAPGGRYQVPSTDDCLACHGGAAVPVLGVSALQLSRDRDPLAARAEMQPSGAVDLGALAARGLLDNLPPALLETPPRINAASPLERAALGYLHANCGHCHNAAGPLLLVDMRLAQSAAGDADATRYTLDNQPSDFHAHGMDRRVVPGNPSASVLALRMRARDPVSRMPPLGTRIVDDEGVALVEDWIQQMLQPDQEIN